MGGAFEDFQFSKQKVVSEKKISRRGLKSIGGASNYIQKLLSKPKFD